MTESVYKMVELVGTSTESWEKAAAAAVALASKTLRDLRVAEVTQLDMHIVDGQVLAYRAKLNLSFKYEDEVAPKARPAAKGRGRAKAVAAPTPPVEEPADDDDDESPAPKKGARKTKRKGAKG
ncbi:MAG TPA: dodecin family protein [Polyangiaceae bacterium]|nr:dodecin family protein [Polyangiaceae bacterium]